MHKLIVSSGWDVSREGGMSWLPTRAALQNIMQNILLIHHGSCFSQGRCHASWHMISTAISGIGCLSPIQHFFPTSCLCQQTVDWSVIGDTLLLINVNNRSQLSSLCVTLLQVLPDNYPPQCNENWGTGHGLWSWGWWCCIQNFHCGKCKYAGGGIMWLRGHSLWFGNQPMDNKMFISIRRDMGSKACHLVSGIQHFCHRVKLSTHYNSMTCNNGCGLNM